MPKLPDDNSEEAIARRAKMSAETRREQKLIRPEPPTEEELAAFRLKHGLADDAVVFMCNRGRK